MICNERKGRTKAGILEEMEVTRKEKENKEKMRRDGCEEKGGRNTK
jgi:hypothetical protein